MGKKGWRPWKPGKVENENMSAIDEAVEVLSNADSVLALTGAGISVASGLRPYRGRDGLWDSGEVDPMEVASQEALQRNPPRVKAYLESVREVARKAEPNPAHVVLARMEASYSRFAVITQNVDGLHLRAGNSRVFEIHGSLHRTRRFREYLIPDVVLFGGMLPASAMRGAESFILRARPQVALVVGTTAMFPYIQGWIHLASRNGARVLELNLEPTVLSRTVTDIFLQGRAETLLPRLWKRTGR